ncbi:Pro-apoptotic serine protease [Beauveria bassiana]|nr:Pro-apoptotic serine protease [Beauveria bassiana]
MLCEAVRQAFRGRAAKSSGCPAHKSRKDLSRIIRNIVVIRFSHTLPFDGDGAQTSEATGFVVDAKRGHILTNRHVAGPGPFWGLCIFGQEAVSCRPLYIDPIHDFAFLKYDPESVQNMKIDGLSLSSGGASVGQPVLVVGNDAGEATSIIDGTISRTDRNAPEYDGPYSDFNISYYMANMNLSGGSSGSPALDEDGLVLGMVSGRRTDGAICFLLPTGPILRILCRLRQGQDVPRGDIQCQFVMKPIYECKGLGLDSGWEERLRRQITASGDILLEVNGAVALQFDELEDAFNENVNGQVSMSLLRSGQLVLGIIDVINLHHIMPKRLVSLGGLFCHDVTYVQAVNMSVAARGVYVAESTEPMLIGDGEPGWIIQSLNGQAVSSLEGFLDRLKLLHKGQAVVVTCAHLESLHRRRTSVLRLDVPSGITVYSLDGATGLWRSATTPLRPMPPAAMHHPFMSKISPRAPFPTVMLNLIHVESRAYLYLDGYPAMLARGMGVIVDAKAGLAVVSRKVVPHKACYITVTLGTATEVGARCVFLHAHHCYAIIQYDVSLAPRQVGGVTLGNWLSDAKASLIYFSEPEQLLHGDATVQSVVLMRPALRSTTPSLKCHPVNADLIEIEAPSEVKGADGVIVSSDGSVQAIWMPGIGGLSATSLSKLLPYFGQEHVPALYVMPAEMEVISTRQARLMGAPEVFVRAVAEYTSNIYMVRGSFSAQLEQGDIVMKLGDKIPVRWADFDIDTRTIHARIWRRDAAQDLELKSIRVDDLETTRCVEFCGACIQPTPLAVRHRLNQDQPLHPRDVYITHVRAGSTADLYSLPERAFVTKMNGQVVRDFNDFVAMAKRLSDGRVLTMTTVTLNGCEDVCVLQSNKEHHPFAEWIYNGTEFVNKL